LHFLLSGTAIVKPIGSTMNDSRRGIKRLRILFWGLRLAFKLFPRVALPAIERLSGVSPKIIRCGFTLFGEAEIPAGWTLGVVVLKG